MRRNRVWGRRGTRIPFSGKLTPDVALSGGPASEVLATTATGGVDGRFRLSRGGCVVHGLKGGPHNGRTG